MRTNNSLTCPLVNLSTRNFVTQKNLVPLLLCLLFTLSFLANNSLTCLPVNLSTHKFVTQKNFVHLLLCLSITLSFLASNSLTCLLAFPHPEKTLHFLKQITLKSIQKTSSRATLQPTENQIVIKP